MQVPRSTRTNEYEKIHNHHNHYFSCCLSLIGLFLYNTQDCVKVEEDYGKTKEFIISKYGEKFSLFKLNKKYGFPEDFVELYNIKDLDSYNDFQVLSWDRFGYNQIVVIAHRKGAYTCLQSQKHGDGIVH